MTATLESRPSANRDIPIRRLDTDALGDEWRVGLSDRTTPVSAHAAS